MTAIEDTGRCDEDAPQQQHQPREETGEEARESCDAALPASPAAPAAPAAPSIATRALSNRGNPVLFATMLDLRAVCRLSLVSRATRNTYGRRARKACLTEGGGVPEDCRVEFWKCALNVEKEMADKTPGAEYKEHGRWGGGGSLYEACLYGDDAEAQTRIPAQTPAEALEEEATAAAVAAAEAGVGMASRARAVLPREQPEKFGGGQFWGEGASESPLPPSGWRALSKQGAEGEISRDVGRTFPSQGLFRSRNGPGQNMLSNVLKACLRTNPDVGYCQGMNFVAGALLLACSAQDPAVAETPQSSSSSGGGTNGAGSGSSAAGRSGGASSVLGASTESWEEEGEDCDGSGEDDSQAEWRSGPAHLKAEKEVFWLMLALTSRLSGVGSGLGMRELWLPGVPQLKVRVFQFDKLLLRELPRLYNHFKAKQLQLEVLVSQWFLTLFSYSLRPPMLLRVLDLTFTDGWKAMFRFGLARLRSVESTLCGLELEGVSRFLRGFRDGEGESPPPSPPPPPRSVVWYNRGGKGRSGSSGGGGGGGRGGGTPELTRASSSVMLLKATAGIKLTRSTLRRLQQDFAVQLLKEHLQGEGQWLTRYGNAPDPTPGAGAGVVGGGADGDVGFMGVEAMTRMMLSDSKLLDRLREELGKMAAPVHADARVFQTKITEASERLQEAAREKSNLSAELLVLKDDIEALGQRKKLVSEQMHLLLVQFEQDSTVSPEQRGHEEEREMRGEGEGGDNTNSSSGGDSAVRVSPSSSSSGGFSGFSPFKGFSGFGNRGSSSGGAGAGGGGGGGGGVLTFGSRETGSWGGMGAGKGGGGGGGGNDDDSRGWPTEETGGGTGVAARHGSGSGGGVGGGDSGGGVGGDRNDGDDRRAWPTEESGGGAGASTGHGERATRGSGGGGAGGGGGGGRRGASGSSAEASYGGVEFCENEDGILVGYPISSASRSGGRGGGGNGGDGDSGSGCARSTGTPPPRQSSVGKKGPQVGIERTPFSRLALLTRSRAVVSMLVGPCWPSYEYDSSGGFVDRTGRR